MTIDVCLVSYNSKKWLPNCMRALSCAAKKVDGIGVYLADNASADDTVQLAESLKKQYAAEFDAFTILPLAQNRGFGAGCNAAARQGKGDYVFFCNLDTEIDEDAFVQLKKAIEQNTDFAAFEMRQIPYEHPKFYDPVTLETAWASGACVAVRRDAFEAVGGFDEAIFMYGEDVELSLHLRLKGYKIRYVPSAIIKHYAYETAGVGKPLQEAGSVLANLYLRYKYGSKKDIQQWDEVYEGAKANLAHYAGALESVGNRLSAMRKLGKKQRGFYRNEVQKSGFSVAWSGLDYTFTRAGAFFEVKPTQQGPLFSVLVRTYRRPQVLEKTLQSLRHQTYRNFEVIVAEDGVQPTAAEVCETAKQWLQLKYLPLGKNAGRSAAGNAAMQAAKGDFFVFLDDDDYFFADHLEAMAQMIAENPQAKMFALGAIEAAAQQNNTTGEYQLLEMRNHGHAEFSFARHCTENYFPIQTVAFSKSLFAAYGGMDEQLDAMEDWDLWTRYACHTTVVMSDKATSLYKVPADADMRKARSLAMNEYRARLLLKWKQYPVSFTAAEVLCVVWSEEQGEKDQQEYAQLQEQKQVVTAICQSNRWKFTSFLRVIPHALACGAQKLAKIFVRWECSIGPTPPPLNLADKTELSQFLYKARRSLCWRITEKKRK